MKNKKLNGILAGVLALVIALLGYWFLKPENDSDIQKSSDTTGYNLQSTDNSDSSFSSQFEEETRQNDNSTSDEITSSEITEASYSFRNKKLLNQHYEKHGIEMGFASAEEYEKAAGDVINNPNALQKTEKEDGDYIFYVESTNEFVVLSVDGYIRTYFLPDAGIAYFNRQ